MSEVLKIRLAARCEAAGRPENEDNFQVAEDLSVSNSGFTTDKIYPLGDKGTLLLVCDGMGGMNAGEVASAIAVKVIKDYFSPQRITSDIIAHDDSICMYMKRAIIEADCQIKEEANRDQAKYGMGSTAVMAWLLGSKVYVAWCGDSRCYRYNCISGLEQLSHDHSYVQDLVDSGQLSPDLAFDHPNKNVITRSLGAPRGVVRPDTKVYDLHAGDVILLCSDGLSDSLRDKEIEQSIRQSLNSMTDCRNALWNDSMRAGWHDNVTIVLAQVLEDNVTQEQTIQLPKQIQTPPPIVSEIPNTPQGIKSTLKKKYPKGEPSLGTQSNNKKIWIIAMIVVGVVAICILFAMVGSTSKGNENQQENSEKYVDLCKKLDNVDIGALHFDDVCEKINNIVNDYKELVELEKVLSENIHQNKSNQYKTTINDGLNKKIDEYSTYSDESKTYRNIVENIKKLQQQLLEIQ